MILRRTPFALLPLLTLAVACSGEVGGSDDGSSEEDEQAFSSNQATLLDFTFQGEVVSDSFVFDATQTINDQMLYTIGHLNGDRAVGRLDRLTLTNVTSTQEGGKTKLRYTAKLPVAWGNKDRVPQSYSFKLPRDISSAAQEAFTTKHKQDCIEHGAHDVNSGSMWYYYRPNIGGCALDASEVVTVSATVSTSLENSSGKYPEYNKVWEDNTLNMVAVFGKYEDGKTAGDAGIDGYNRFLATMRSTLSGFGVTTQPSVVGGNPGVNVPDVTFSATLPDGKKVNVTALLVDNVRTADPNFNARYTQLSTTADIISYNGHAGLGQNVRALAQKGAWKKGQYVIVFMNGCDTFAYVDGSLAQTRARLNSDDPTGTKYMEFVTNTMPAFFASMADASTTLFKGLLRFDAPMTYNQIFTGIDDDQVVLVTGEEDNTFKPGAGATGWQGINATFDLAKSQDRRFATGLLQPGSYTFSVTGTGNANLYVKAGSTPTSRTFDCKSVNAGSTESCSLSVQSATNVNALVRGAAASQVTFLAKKN